MSKEQNTPKYRAFFVTLRPKEGLTAEHEKLLLQLIRKRSQFHYVVTEKDGVERHAHVAMFVEVAIFCSNLTKSFARVFKDLLEGNGSVWRVCYNCKVMYNDDVISNYMKKDANVRVLIDNLPKDTQEYYPEKNDQRLKNDKEIKDYFMYNLTQKFKAYQAERPKQDLIYCASEFLSDEMANFRMRYIMCPCRNKQLIYSLVHCLTGDSRYRFHSGVQLFDQYPERNVQNSDYPYIR